MKSEDDRQAAKGTGRRRLKVAGEVLIFLFYLLVLDQVIYRLPVEPVTIQHPDGWLEHAWTPPVSWEDKKAYWRRVYREEVLLDYEIRGAPDLAFRRFLELAGENGIPVKLLNMPVTAEQMEFFTRGEYDAYIDYMTRTADDFGIELIDYNTPEKRAPLEWYHDTHHLNTHGAEGFSDIVADDVVGPFFAGANPS